MSKLVIVTGSSRGLGEQISLDLVNAGYRVLGISRSAHGNKLSGNEMFQEVLFDLSRTEAIPKLSANIVESHGEPYGLVNNAAIGADGLLATQKNEDIEETISLNLLSPILLTKYLSRQMLEKKEGRVVNISSVVASTGYRGLSVYASTKAGLLGFTRSLSRELGPRGITVNSVQPGFMHTEMTAGLSGDNLSKIERRSALGRLAEAKDVSSIVLHLMGETGRNITGQSIVVDAGNIA